MNIYKKEQLIPANYRTGFINQKDDFNTSEMYKCEGLFAEYIRKLRAGHGQMKSELTETDRSARPSVILSAPDVQRTDAQTTEITRLTLLHCLGDDTLKRRRYVLINYQNFSFILGGYDFDIKSKIRSQPLHDFVYDINNKTCRSIPSFPAPGRIAFGVAPSERYIVIIGGHTYDNVSLSSGLIFDTQNIDEAPGVAFNENRVIVIGGYDIIAGDTDMLSSHYHMDLNEKVWHRYADLNPPRARTLIICMYRGDELGLYGGYTLVDGKAKVIDTIYTYNAKKDKWKKLTDIPDLQIYHAITIAQTNLIVSKEVPNPDDPDQPDIYPIRKYDFETDEWTEMNNEELDDQQNHRKKK